MIRSFQLRDWALVRRLSEQGVSLHSESALTDRLQPLRGALVNMLVGGDFPTLVWKAEKGSASGFIQLYLEEESQRAHILYLSPTVDAGARSLQIDIGEAVQNGVVDGAVWLPLLDQAVIEVGQRGVHSLVAEVSEQGGELPVLRRAGFAIYTRQDIWVLSGEETAVFPDPDPSLRPREAADDWDIQLLYANIVPRLVQLVEPVPRLDDGEGWVLREDDELAAFIHIHDGPRATWLRLFIHPNAEARVDEIVKAALSVRPASTAHPVYCCVRRYQSWIQNALERHGFAFWGSQAVMVKHTVQHQQKPMRDLAAILEKQAVSASAPMVQRWQHEPEQNGRS
ncbi:MAG: hypothetical protein H6668_08885 [Ardenticatenaceae bacterium]|nr:hypothetical protein [Ardenticatenaceae bacterium]